MFRKSLSRVTNTAPNTNAVAAIQRSFSSIGSPACSRVRLTRARIHRRRQKAPPLHRKIETGRRPYSQGGCDAFRAGAARSRTALRRERCCTRPRGPAEPFVPAARRCAVARPSGLARRWSPGDRSFLAKIVKDALGPHGQLPFFDRSLQRVGVPRFETGHRPQRLQDAGEPFAGGLAWRTSSSTI